MNTQLIASKQTEYSGSIIHRLAALFILISAITICLGYVQFKNVLGDLQLSDRSTAKLAAMVLKEHEKTTRGILESYASRPSFISNIKEENLAGVLTHLADMKKNNDEIDLTFLTDRDGQLWANYPIFPEAIGRDLSDRNWYTGVSANWQTYTSTVFNLIIDNKPLAVAVAVPVFDEKGSVIAILANSFRLTFINTIFASLNLGSTVAISVIDQVGHTIYNNINPPGAQLTEFPFYKEVKQGVREEEDHLEINNLDKQEKKVSCHCTNKKYWLDSCRREEFARHFKV